MNGPANEKANDTLAAYLRGGRLPHALLVEGPPGSGKERFARRAAQAALCAGDGLARPCGVCRDCVKAEKGIHPDILVYGGGNGGARSFHVDEVRAIRQEAHVRPNEAEGKALILLGAQDMSVQAQNALLKIVEEPPKGVTFVLTCENKAALLGTILSRVAVISLAPPEPPEGPDGDAAAGILYNACVGGELDALAALAAYERDRQGLTALLGRMSSVLGEALLRPGGDERMAAVAARAGSLRLIRILDILEDTAEAARHNANGPLLATSLCGRIRAVMAGASSEAP